MARIKLEYIWLDGYEPVQNLRSKTKVVDGDVSSFSLSDCEDWDLTEVQPCKQTEVVQIVCSSRLRSIQTQHVKMRFW